MLHLEKKVSDPEDPIEQFNLAKKFDSKQELKEAARLYTLSANQGYAAAQTHLAWMYAEGQGVEKNEKEAVRLYRLAAEQDFPAAQAYLASMYEKGRGIEKDEKEAARLYHLAAEKANAAAQFNLALMYEDGRGVKQDKKEAVHLYRLLTTKQGYYSRLAQYNLGLLYEEGEGVEKDEKEAARLYGLAAKQGYADAQINLALMFENGRGVEKDEKEAARLYRQAADQNSSIAQSNLALMYRQGRGVEKDEQEAAHLYSLAADQGNAFAQCSLGVMYVNGSGVEKDEKEAVRFYRMAATQKYDVAQYNLGVEYALGRGVAQDLKEAARWYHLAAAQGHIMAQFNLALMYEDGRGGIKKDEKEAVRLFTLAADQGHVRAQSHLGWMYKEGRGVEKNEKKALELFLQVAKQIQTKEGKTLSLDDIKKNMDTDKPFYIPSIWPLPFDQTDFNCGLYALNSAVTRSLGESAIPVTRKEGKKDVRSVRQLAKELELTEFGEIYDVNAFKILTDKLGIENCEIVNAGKIEKEDKYIQLICDHLDEEYELIAACDLTKGSKFPASQSSGGNHTHWALIFGYFYSKGECHFLVAQYGNYYIWNAADLYQSNKQLPENNPKKNPHYGFYKVGKQAHFVPLTSIPAGVKVRSLIEDKLTKFSCGLFGIINKNQGPGVQVQKMVSPQKT